MSRDGVIARLTPAHAREAARLHIAGQTGTYLTSLGPGVLEVFYRTLPDSPAGFGFVALADDAEASQTIGFLSATTSVGALLLEMGTRRLGQLLPPLLASFVRRPALAVRSVQTALYPLLAHASEGNGPAAELLSIMVEPDYRSQGAGAALMQAFLGECRNRKLTQVTVTVDAANAGALRFYARHGFAHVRRFTLYGRAMVLYARRV